MCVVRSEASMDDCVWGTARLKFDFVAMVLGCRGRLAGLLLSKERRVHSQGAASDGTAVAGRGQVGGEVGAVGVDGWRLAAGGRVWW